MNDAELEKIGDFLMALSNALDNGQTEFTCPLCGGEVKMVRAPGNGHIHAACVRCGIRMCE